MKILRKSEFASGSSLNEISFPVYKILNVSIVGLKSPLDGIIRTIIRRFAESIKKENPVFQGQDFPFVILKIIAEQKLSELCLQSKL
jgi:hypothetical protein